MEYKFFDIAYDEALKAYNNGEVPVGCVIVKNNKVLAKAHNLKMKNNCSLDHAELIAIKKASKKINNWRLNNCDIYVTLDPCPMCASAIKQARINNVYSLCSRNIYNTHICNLIYLDKSNDPKINFVSNLDNDKIKKLLTCFFSERR